MGLRNCPHLDPLFYKLNYRITSIYYVIYYISRDRELIDLFDYIVGF
jgi:hypothetical protein